MAAAKYLEIAMYLLHLGALFLWLIPYFGQSIFEKCKRNIYCSHRFSRGFNGLYDIDLSDGQWREFRQSLYLLIIAMVCSCVVQYLLHRYSSVRIANFARLIFGLVFVAIQHKYHALIVIGLAMIGYVLPKMISKARYSFSNIWIFGILIILFKESYRIRSWFPLLFPFFDHNRYGGIYSWHLAANFLVLRIISFGLDYCWTKTHFENNITEKELATQNISSNVNIIDAAKLANFGVSRDIIDSDVTINMDDYNLTNYLSYVFYAPLYIAGPILTFNEYVVQVKSPYRIPAGSVVYVVRWILCFLLLEYLLTKFPFFAVVNSGLYLSLSPAELAVVFYMILKLMWLKFLLLWRFFRMWSLFEGFQVTENMKRCMSNNCSLEQFWRGWHASFNKWLIRYLYSPLGGKHSKFVSGFMFMIISSYDRCCYYLWFIVCMVFIFVAIWHDIELKLLLWGALNSVFLLIEMLAQRLVLTTAYRRLPHGIRLILRTAGSASYIIILITVNLIGYSVGAGSLSSIFNKFYTPQGFWTIGICFYFLCWGVQFMRFLDQEGLVFQRDRLNKEQ